MNLVVFDPEVVAELDSHFEDDIARSKPVDPPSWEDRSVLQRAKETVTELVERHM